jgi:hypothetical protein
MATARLYGLHNNAAGSSLVATKLTQKVLKKDEQPSNVPPNPLFEDESLKNIEPRMIEIILNEVILEFLAQFLTFACRLWIIA